MGYIKVISDGYIIGIGENKNAKGNISEKEYKDLVEIFKKMPEPKDGCMVMLREKDLSWIQIEKPEESDDGKGSLTPDEAWKIISSSNISKEDKEKLYNYIYAKEELK